MATITQARYEELEFEGVNINDTVSLHDDGYYSVYVCNVCDELVHQNNDRAPSYTELWCECVPVDALEETGLSKEQFIEEFGVSCEDYPIMIRGTDIMLTETLCFDSSEDEFYGYVEWHDVFDGSLSLRGLIELIGLSEAAMPENLILIVSVDGEFEVLSQIENASDFVTSEDTDYMFNVLSPSEAECSEFIERLCEMLPRGLSFSNF